MIKVKSVSIRSNIPDEDLKGLTLSFFAACIKANKSNQPASLKHFFRERLERRAHRAALNQVLNTLSQAIGGDKFQKEVGSLQSQKISRAPIRLQAYKGRLNGLPKPINGFMYVVNGLDLHSPVLELPKAVFYLLEEEEGDHLDHLVELGYDVGLFSESPYHDKVAVTTTELMDTPMSQLREKAEARLAKSDDLFDD